MDPRRTKIKDLLASEACGGTVTVAGWVRTHRASKNVHFMAVNDGSIIHAVQVVADADRFGEHTLGLITTGTCLRVTGVLVASPARGQRVEIQAQDIEIYGTADAQTYPLQKKGHSLEFLREIAHLRPRTNTFGAVLRLRHAMSYAVHEYFHKKGFYCLHAPIITGSDCEGAGKMFRVTTLDMDNPPRRDDRTIDYSQDFFGGETKLTVSGQLEGELGALALGAIYTFGPTFRAENSNTPRHLAEFWMVEPEMAFYDLDDTIDLAEDFLKHLLSEALAGCRDDLEFLEKTYDHELTARLQSILGVSFERLAYAEALDILKKSGKKFEFPVGWGQDLQAEHERYLVEEHCKRPVVLTDYPREIKPFYMKLSDDGRTVRAMDVLFPRVGEIVGGSQREDSYEKLAARIAETGVPEKDVWWYLETRKFGSAPHSGFGLGFERLMLFVSGMSNIRDVIPFPRTPGNAAF